MGQKRSKRLTEDAIPTIFCLNIEKKKRLSSVESAIMEVIRNKNKI